ncbi:SURF1 family protein [Rhizobium sp. L1K21]|uniref:SURF1 family protein n=1 Tax=Rhizobium sp. L1K21 TaxID=2954933 RepID=UPI002092C6B8|nr:SURF1 family protein [Rhizobium sp. L1K21]MCO6186835.1 SURF1 family protein [Rhizobium sp. L1K21]
MPASRSTSAVKKAVTAIVLLAVLAALLSLGTWQVRRLAWKEALIADVNARIKEQPVKIGEIIGDLAAGTPIEYRPMQATGVFQHDAEQFFFATYEGRSGFYVYTPLALVDGQYLFVNRGFVPYDQKDRDTRLEGEVEGEVTVTGLARTRLAEKPSMMVPDNDPAKNIFYWKDLSAMAANAGLPSQKVLQFFLDADATPNPGGLPVGGVTQIDFPNNHLQYAITWYGLAAALVVISAIVWWRGQKKE